MRALVWLGLLLPSVLGAQVTYTPQPLNFGSVKLGATSAIFSSTLKNTGTDTLRFTGGSSMTGSTAFSYVTDNCTARPPGTTCVLQYRFAPKTVGTLTGANVVQTNHGPFPLNFTGVGLDTVTPPPPPPPVAGSVNYIAVQPTGIGAPAGGPFYYLSALPFDSGGHVLAAPLTWSVADTSVAQLVPFGVLGTQVVQVTLRASGTTTVSASAGGKVGNIALSVGPAVPLPTPPPLAAPIFGIRASWVNLLAPIGCPATPGSTCTRGPLPVFSDSGVVQAQMTVTATFAPP